MQPKASYALALLCAVSWSAPHASSTVQDDSITISLPAEWIPFQADVINISDRHVTTGKFYRRRDGSTAHYLDTPGAVAITINNFATRERYVKLGDREWMTQVIQENAIGAPRRELRLPRQQVQVFHDAVLGDVYELTNKGSAGVTRLVPRLNGFRVSDYLANGVSSEYLNIAIGDQPDQLFMPRTAAHVH